jgi:hypothetical protein
MSPRLRKFPVSLLTRGFDEWAILSDGFWVSLWNEDDAAQPRS